MPIPNNKIKTGFCFNFFITFYFFKKYILNTTDINFKKNHINPYLQLSF